jgi:collagenase-like PrtC family protease
MPGLEFSVPYNNDPQTLIELFELKELNGNRIREVYLSGPQQYSASGRIVEEIDEAKFAGIIDLIHHEGMRVDLVMNPTCEGLEWYKLEVVNDKLDFLKRMHREHGLEAVTVANPLYVEAIHETCPDIEVGASVLGDIDSVQRVTIYENLGASVVTPDVDVNRNLTLLKRMKNAVKAEFKIMVNDGCLYKCPFRRFHFNYISHKSKELGPVEGDSFFAHCSQVISRDYAQILKSGWVRPEDLESYAEVSRFFKIVGRARPRTMVVRTVKAYMNQSWSGDLLDIMSGSINKYCLEFGAGLDNKSLSRAGFFNQVTSCGYECDTCSYCDELAKKLIHMGVLTRGKLEDLGHGEMADKLEKTGQLPKNS